MSNESNPDEPKLVVDDDWKSQVEQEKEELRKQESEQSDSDGQEAMHLPPASFSILISTLSTQAIASMGFIPDPQTGQPSQNKAMAKHFIDTIAVLEEKTAGNLDKDESELIQQTLHQLRMAFISAPDVSQDASSEKTESSSIEIP